MAQSQATKSVPPLLELKGICKVFTSKAVFRPTRRVVAADNVHFRVDRGEAVALVGESGSGKSTLARLVLRLESPDRGQILLDGVDILSREPHRASLGYRGRVQMVFQDPFGSLNPVHDVAHHLERPLLRHGRALNPVNSVGYHLLRPLRRQQDTPVTDLRSRVLELLRIVGLEPAEDFIHRHPYELSGGQRQRVAIARALAVEPDLLVADEPTSMLDVSIRMGVLNLLANLKREHRLAILLITHDLASARYLADRILVLFKGRIVEDGSSEAIVADPKHPYTRALLDSIANSTGAGTKGHTPASAITQDGGEGCPFVSRCAEVMDACRKTDPEPRVVGDRRVRCHLYPQVEPTPAVVG